MWTALVLAVVVAAGLVWLWRGRLLKDRVWYAAWAIPAVGCAALAVLVARDPYGLQKLVAQLIMPCGLVWMGFIAAAATAWMRRSWLPAAGLSLLLVAYTLAGNVWLGGALVRSLESRYPPRDLQALEPLDALCVLGGGTELGPDGAPQFGSSGERLAYAVRLHRAQRAPLLVISGSGIASYDGVRDLDVEGERLVTALGVPVEAVLRLPGPRNTSEEIAAYRRLAAERGWKRVGLCTSAWHLPRAMELAQREGLDVVPLPAGHLGRAMPPTGIWLIPQDHGFRLVETACWERLGMLVGR